MQAQQQLDINTLWRSLQNLWHGLLTQAPFIAIGLLIFLAFLVAARVVRKLITAAGERMRLQVNLAQLLSRLASAIVQIIGFLVAAVVVFPAFKPGDLVTGLGITSVAIGFAFKDILQNFFAGILLLLQQPFTVGDQIRSGEFEGTVEAINIRSTIVKTYAGERAVLPNGDVYTRAILVRTAYGKRRAKFTVGIGYPDSIDEARAVMTRVVSEAEGVLKEPGPKVYLAELAGSSVNFNVYFWTEPQQANVLEVSDRVACAIKLALDAAKIDMPYPHTVVLLEDRTSGSGAAGAGKRAPE